MRMKVIKKESMLWLLIYAFWQSMFAQANYASPSGDADIPSLKRLMAGQARSTN